MSDFIRRSEAIQRIKGTGYADQIKDNFLYIMNVIPPAEAVELSAREKQIIWDALFKYRDFCREHADSDHFAADVFAEIYNDVEKLQVRFYEEWSGEITH